MKSLKHALYAMLGIATIGFSACSNGDDEVATPNFPESPAAVTFTTADITKTLTVTPNYNWSIIADNSWLRFMEGDQTVSSLGGKATKEPITITMCVDENSRTFEDQTTEIKLSMNGQTKSIATVTLQKKEREIKFYNAAGETITAIEITYNENSDLYNANLSKIEANFAWKTISAPEWLKGFEPLSAEIDNDTKIAAIGSTWITADPAKFEDQAMSGTIVFQDAENETFTFPLSVSFVGADDKFISVSGLAYMIEFTASGNKIGLDGSVTDITEIPFSITALDGYEIFKIEQQTYEGMSYWQQCWWVNIFYDDTTRAIVPSNRKLLNAIQNEGEPRTASVFIIPSAYAKTMEYGYEDLMDESGNIKEIYLPYQYTISQAGKSANESVVSNEGLTVSYYSEANVYSTEIANSAATYSFTVSAVELPEGATGITVGNPDDGNAVVWSDATHFSITGYAGIKSGDTATGVVTETTNKTITFTITVVTNKRYLTNNTGEAVDYSGNKLTDPATYLYQPQNFNIPFMYTGGASTAACSLGLTQEAYTYPNR